MNRAKIILLVVVYSVSLHAKVQKVFSPSDYPNFPEKTYKYFVNLLPTQLNHYLLKKHNASFITSCKGSYVNKDAHEYVVGFINGKINKGYSKVFSINKKSKKITETLVMEYSDIAAQIMEYQVPVIEVYCKKGFIFSKLPVNGLPAYIYNEKKKAFEYSEQNSMFAP